LHYVAVHFRTMGDATNSSAYACLKTRRAHARPIAAVAPPGDNF
jgi:hypothetical protein